MTHATTTASTVSPAFHIRPEFGWLNDPNGPVFWQGRWHLFFQHNPQAPVHANVHWGHVSSPNLISWQREPIALFPRSGMPDAEGCWSGCVVVDDGAAWAVYSGHPGHDDPGNICIARSSGDLSAWQQPEFPVVTAPEEVAAMRDPFVFSHAGHRWAIVGAGLRDGRSAVLLYGCDDLHRWVPAGYLLTSADTAAAGLPEAEVWECPQLALVDGRWVLVLSLQRNGAPSDVYYLVGALVPSTDEDHVHGSEVERASAEAPGLRFRTEGCGLVDAGRDFYAPAVLVRQDRVLLWGWSWEARAEAAVADTGWAGLLTLPRQLEWDHGVLRHVPAAEVGGLRRGRPADSSLHDGEQIEVSATCEVSCAVEPSTTGTISLTDPQGEELLSLVLGGSRHAITWAGAVTRYSVVPEVRRPDGVLEVNFMIDRSILEATCTGLMSATVRSSAATGGSWRLRYDGSGVIAVTTRELGLPSNV